MKKSFRKLACIIAAATMVLSLTACTNGGDDKTTDKPEQKVTQAPASQEQKQDQTQTQAPAVTTAPEGPKEIKTIRWGTHWADGLDPHKQDEVTGEFIMEENQREARLAAEQAVLDQLGVKIEYVQYAADTRESLLQSVMANDPVADLCVLWGGCENTIIGQNIIKPLDDFKYLFDENESMSWQLCDKLYGHYFLMSDVTRFMPRWPLIYNINMVEAVDSLKDANGNTIYPNTLFDQGKWTWSVFKDYLEKIDAYYANNPTIDAYYTDTRFATLSAAYSNGTYIYGPDGLGVQSTEMKEAWNFVNSLLKEGLITVELYDDGFTPGWCWPAYHIGDGQTVFADAPDWEIKNQASKRAEQGESVGIVPWPRPDDMAIDDPGYQQVMTAGDSICILKGIDDETAELAIRTLLLYTEVYCEEIAGVDSYEDYVEEYATTTCTDYGFDIFHEKIGDSILNSFLYLTEKVAGGNDFSDILGFRVPWDTVIGKSFFGIDGFASYDVAIEQNMAEFDKVVETMNKNLAGDKPVDNTAPNVTKRVEPIAVPAGTKMTDAIWGDYIVATDNSIAGELDLSHFCPEFNHVEENDLDSAMYSEDTFKTVGYYNRAFRAYFKDDSGNKGYCTISVYVYDSNNKKAPTVVVNDNPAEIALNTDVASIAWAGENGFIKSAVDADGLDVSANVSADLSTIDTTLAGTYNVALNVTDFAGNSTKVTVKVVVK